MKGPTPKLENPGNNLSALSVAILVKHIIHKLSYQVVAANMLANICLFAKPMGVKLRAKDTKVMKMYLLNR